MRPNLPRGQAPARGVLHVQRFAPMVLRFDEDGRPRPPLVDPDAPPGYWCGQHTNLANNAGRARKRVIGARQLRRRMSALRRLHNIDLSLGL